MTEAEQGHAVRQADLKARLAASRAIPLNPDERTPAVGIKGSVLVVA